MEDQINKVYYSISEVSKLLLIGTSALRNYESKFNLKIGRRRNGFRVYTKNNISTLKHIKYLLREEGHTISGAIRKFNRRINDN